MTNTPKPLYSARKLFFPILFVGALFWVTLFRKTPELYSFYGTAMGTTWSVLIVPSRGQTISSSEIQMGIQQELDTVNQLMSTYLPDSEISQLNRHDTSSFELSSETASVIKAGLDLFKKSEGSFDITIGPAVNAWGFGFPPSTNSPTSENLISLSTFVGSKNLSLLNNSIRKKHSQTQVDLSAIAKGFAVDQVVQYLDQQGYNQYLIEVGGEIFTRGSKNDEPWVVAVEQPSFQKEAYNISFPMSDLALATSGDYRNFIERDGQRYSHTIDPRTLKPVEHNIASISVVTTSVTAADAWATALNVVGEEDAFRLAEEYDLAIYMLIRESDGSFRARSNAAFAELIKD